MKPVTALARAQTTTAHSVIHPLKRPLLIVMLRAFALCLLSTFSARAGGDVAGCTEQDFLDALAGGGNVTFTEDCSITLSNTITIDFDFDTTIDTQGHSVTINGGPGIFVFNVASNFTCLGLTIAEGQNTNGGGLYINQGATVVLSNCTLSGNSAIGTNGAAGANGSNSSTGNGGNGHNGTAGGAGLGGAIFNLGDLTLLNCTLATNNATSGSGGNGGNGGTAGSGAFSAGNGGNGAVGGIAAGGAVYNLGTLFLSNCTFSGNNVLGANGGVGGTNGGGAFPGLPGSGAAGGSASGAGIYSTNRITVMSCTFSDNTAQGGNSAAGGMQAGGDGITGAQGANGLGGGICTTGGAVTNCTFFNNKAAGGAGGNGGNGSSVAGSGGNGGNASGGGLYNNGQIIVVNCTFSSCGAVGGTNGLAGSGAFPGSNGSKGASRGGNIANGSSTFTLINSIIATNSSGLNAYGTITDGLHNISSDATPGSFSSAEKNKDPKLGPLANNGGPTMTMALLTNSPALDQGDDSACPAFDQRGVPRPQGAHCDIGAYEATTLPGIIDQPQSQTRTNGGSVTFAVGAVGNPPLEYQWRFVGTNFYYGTNIYSSASTNFAFTTTPAFTISHVTVTNAGNYSVRITNSFGSVTSSVATLSILPYIVAQPTNNEVAARGNATFTVTAAADRPSSYQWFFNRTNLIAGATNSSYTLVNAQATNDGATYNVVITNSIGSVTSVLATLRVDAAPAIVTQPTNQVVALHQSVTLSVVATGTQPLAYQWRLNGAYRAGATLADYTFNDAQTNDAGSWDVVVTNRFGVATSAPPAILRVFVPGAITQARLVSNNFSFVFQSQSGFTYITEYKTNLRDPGWLALATNIGDGGTFTNKYSTAIGPSRFYRIRVQ